MQKVILLFLSSLFLLGCQNNEKNKVSRVPLEESESFYLSQVPRKIQVVNDFLFVLERYHQSIGLYNITNGKNRGSHGLEQIDFRDLYNSVFQTDSLVWEYDSIFDLPNFVAGNRIENFWVQEDTLRVMLSLSIPYHDSDISKVQYRHWHRHNFIIAFDLKSKDYLWRRLDREGYDIKKVAVGNFSNFYVNGDYLITPVNLVNDSSTKIMALKKYGQHLYRFHGLIPLKNNASIELMKNLYLSEIINNQKFIRVNSTAQKNYEVVIDYENNISLRPYNISKEVVLNRYFPAKLKQYSCTNSVGDTILSLDWGINSVPFVNNDTREIFYISYEDEKYSLYIVPF